MSGSTIKMLLVVSSLLSTIIVGAVISYETTQNIWNTKTVFDTTHLPDTTYLNVLADSPIECVLTALTYNRSMATYDGSSQWCFLHATIKLTATSIAMALFSIYVVRQDIKTCEDLDPGRLSGVYRITPVPGDSFDVFCDMDSEGSPWTVIQNRESKEVDFFRNWDQYKNGFGNLLGNFWLGNEHIFTLTRTPCMLRIKLESLNGTFGYADYSEFQISDEAGNYKLSVTGFSGNISNSFEKSKGQLFTTLDRENDLHGIHHCAEKRHGAWWYRNCAHTNLNGMYEYDPSNFLFSMYWRDFFRNDIHDPMKTSKMMLKKP